MRFRFRTRGESLLLLCQGATAEFCRAAMRHAPPAWEAMLIQAGLVDRIAKGRAPGDAWVALERLMLALAGGGAGAARLLARA